LRGHGGADADLDPVALALGHATEDGHDQVVGLVGAASRRHHIGIGRAHAGTPILIRTTGPDITIISTATGEILRQLTLDPARNYQPTGAPKGRTPRHPK
jgi:hypothetical protein